MTMLDAENITLIMLNEMWLIFYNLTNSEKTSTDLWIQINIYSVCYFKCLLLSIKQAVTEYISIFLWKVNRHIKTFFDIETDKARMIFIINRIVLEVEEHCI